MLTRILYIPWKGNEGKHFRNKCVQWEKFYNNNPAKVGKQAIVVQYDKETMPNVLGHGDQIYIMGHGSPGSETTTPNLGSKNGGLKAEDITARLIASGLTSQFSGTFKIYICHSASKGSEPFSFAEHCYMALHEKLYNFRYEPIVFGYVNAIDGTYVDGNVHRYGNVLQTKTEKKLKSDNPLENILRFIHIRPSKHTVTRLGQGARASAPSQRQNIQNPLNHP